MVILIAFLLMLSGLSKSVKDTLAHHFNGSIFSNLNRNYWDINISWTNKWTFPYAIDSKPKFWGSTTFLSWTTDAWHLFDTIQSTCWQLAMAICIQKSFILYSIGIICNEKYDYLCVLALLLIIKILIGVPFELTYSHLFKNK